MIRTYTYEIFLIKGLNSLLKNDLLDVNTKYKAVMVSLVFGGLLLTKFGFSLDLKT